MLLRLGVLTGEHANYSQITKCSHFRLNLWLLCFIKGLRHKYPQFQQYFKDKLSSHQLSHIHNTRHRASSNFNTPLFNHSKTEKCFLYQVIPIWNSIPSSRENCTSKLTFKKTNKKPSLSIQILTIFNNTSQQFQINNICIYFSLSSPPTYFRILSFPMSHATLWGWFKCYHILTNLLQAISILFNLL